MNGIEAKSTTNARKLIDVSSVIEQLKDVAIQDSKQLGQLYTLPEYVREILSGFLQLKEKHQNITPKDLPGLLG